MSGLHIMAISPIVAETFQLAKTQNVTKNVAEEEKLDHQRIILCGPSMSVRSFMANHLRWLKNPSVHQQVGPSFISIVLTFLCTRDWRDMYSM